MGFLDAIEREKQQRLQEELAKQKVFLKASGVEPKGVEIPAIDKQALDQAYAQDFFKDGTALLGLLQNLNQLGYPDYFTGVARITGNSLESRLYVRNGYYCCTRASIVLHGGYSYAPFTRSEIYLSNAIAQTIEDTQERIRQELLKLNSAEYSTLPPHHFMRQPAEEFFDNNNGDREYGNTKYISRIVSTKDKKDLSKPLIRKQLSLRERIAAIFSQPVSVCNSLPTEQVVNWFTEPHEVGIGFRFLKHLKGDGETKAYYDKESGGYMMGHGYHVDTRREDWYNAIYVRIMTSGQATITGSDQLEIEISDLRFFDDTLEEVMKCPAIIYSRSDEHRYDPPMPVHHGF